MQRVLKTEQQLCKRMLLTVITIMLILAGVNVSTPLVKAEGEEAKWKLTVTDLYDGSSVSVSPSEEAGITKAVIDNGVAYHEYQLTLRLNDNGEEASITSSLSNSQYSSKWIVSTEENEDKDKVATLNLRSNGICVFNDSFDDFSFELNVTSIDTDILLKSAVWHDVELEYQGGNKYGISTVLNETELQNINSDNGTYTVPFTETVSDMSHIVIWEYEKKSYTTKSGATVEYYDRVAKKDAPVVTDYDSEADKITVNNINKDNPIAIMTTEKLSVPKKEDNKYDCYWFYYYTDEYVKDHGNFTLDFYNYEKDAETGIVTLENYNKGLSGYANAALAIGSDSTLSLKSLNSIEDERYGNSKLPESLTAEDFELENWNIPASYTDPYDGVTYRVVLVSNFVINGSNEKLPNALPLYPVSAENITVDSGVGFPDDCSYLFYESTTFGMGGASEGAAAHGWVGAESISNEGRPDNYHQSTRGNTKSFKIVGDDMADNVNNMSNMFRLCSAPFGMTEFDISGINTSNVTDMSNMINVYLAYGDDLKGLSSINTSKAANMHEMFKIRVNEKEKPVDIAASDLAGFNTSSVTDMEGMFADSDIRSLDLSGFTFSSVTTMKDMFFRDYRLEELTLPATVDTSKVTDMSEMFKGCQSLKSIANLNALDTGNVTTMAGMFGEYYFKYGKKYGPIEYFGPAMEGIDLSGFDTKNVTDMSGMFWMPELKTLDISTFDTGKVTTMSKMFNFDSLTALDVSGLNTENVTDMSGMFTLGSANTLDVSSLKVSKVTNMSNMFTLKKATSLNLGDSFDTSKVTNVSGMFTLDSIKKFDLSLNLSSANSLSSLLKLNNCNELTLAIKGPEADDTNIVLDINAPKLVVLDISGSDANLTKTLYSSDSYSGTFNNCGSLVDIYLPDTMPNSYSNGTPTLPAGFYLVGRDDGETTITDFTDITGDLSAYKVVNGDNVVIDSRSDRPILAKENAILLRVAETNPVAGVSIKIYKRDENGDIIRNGETNENEYEDIAVNDAGVKEITLYRYDGVTNNYSKYILDGYSNYIDLFAITDPAKAYPSPNISWKVEEIMDSDDKAVFTGVNGYSDNEFSIGAYNGTGSATVTVTVEGYDKGDGSEVESFTDTVIVNVLPMIRAERIDFDVSYVEMKPGETKANPAKVWNTNEIHEGKEVTFPGVAYESDKPEVVEVDAITGELTAKGIGTATITATSKDPSHIKATCAVKVTETGAVEQDDITINWLYLTADNTIIAGRSEDDDVVACIGTTGTLDEMKAKGTISYDKSTNAVVLNNYNELNLCIFKQGVNVLLKDNNKISGYNTPAVDGFCIDADCTLKAETGASLTVPKTAFEVHGISETEKFVFTLDSSVTRTDNADGTIVFAGPKKGGQSPTGEGDKTSGQDNTQGGNAATTGTTPTTETPATETPAATPAVGTTQQDNNGTATYTVSETSKDEAGNTVVEVTYVEPATTDKKASSVVIPDSVTLADGTVAQVTEIAADAFKKDTKLKNVTIGSNIETIGSNAFSGCSNLTKVTIKGSGLKVINSGAFSNCKKLTKVTLGKNVTTIGKNAFSGNKKLKMITINGNMIKKIGKNAFKGIKKKAVITVQAKNKKTYNKVVKMIKKSGAKNVRYKIKKKS